MLESPAGITSRGRNGGLQRTARKVGVRARQAPSCLTVSPAPLERPHTVAKDPVFQGASPTIPGGRAAPKLGACPSLSLDPVDCLGAPIGGPSLRVPAPLPPRPREEVRTKGEVVQWLEPFERGYSHRLG